MESDAPITEEFLSEFLSFVEIGRLKAICTLALRGLEIERVREETLEECAALADGWDFGAPISREIRALKKGTSDDQSA